MKNGKSRSLILLISFTLLVGCAEKRYIENVDAPPVTVNMPQVVEQCKAQPLLPWCKPPIQVREGRN